jgi:hypothetical protein
MMDLLDPKKRRIHNIKLAIGYILIAIAIGMTTILLLYTAYGYGLHKGQVIQNGLVFVSSTPDGSKVSLNGQQRGTTGERLFLQAGSYTMKIERDGYRTWQRALTVEGGTVEHFDYPFLFPTSLHTSAMQTYASTPGLATQSPDRRWILVEQPDKFGTFDMYDVKDPKNRTTATVAIPDSALTAVTGDQSLKLVEWSNDNKHVLIQHMYSGSSEYIMLDTQDPTQSVNLTKTLNLAPTAALTLLNKQFDKYFVYDTKSQTLGTTSISTPTLTPMLTHVLAFKTYNTNIVLYVTDQGASRGQVDVKLFQNNKSYLIRTLPTDTAYLVNLAQYSGSWYVAAGAVHDNRVFVYQDPISVLSQGAGSILIPNTVLRVNQPDYLEFSANTQFVVAAHANQFAVYDAEYDKTYAYTIDAPFDAPQPHATWMDGDRLMYVSNGKLVVFDYDSTNLQTLMPDDPGYLPFFDQNYHYEYGLATSPATDKAPAQLQLDNTALLTTADLP